MHILETGTIRILNPSGATAGTGWIATPRLAITCAHVIKSFAPNPGDIVTFVFHLSQPPSSARVLRMDPEDDVAVLGLVEGLPEKTQPLGMRTTDGVEGLRYLSLGYPEGGKVEPRWPQDYIGGTVPVLGYAHRLFELKGPEIDRGCSGGAVVLSNGVNVIGMITGYDDLSRPEGGPPVRLAYMIPSETIWRILPESDRAQMMEEIPSDGVTASRHTGSFGGDVDHSTIVVGNGNIIQVIQQRESAPPVRPVFTRSPLLDGINQLPLGQAGRIQNFLTEYLGTKDHPEPFGGREDTLTQLDNWLSGNDKPYLLLTAPAGRGKSALMVRWLERLQIRSDLAIAFVPASVRFGTNLGSVFFSSLAARLAFLHGETISTRTETPPEVWRGLVDTYLSRSLPDGRTLLVVLDALDEAGDWQAGRDLLPLTLPIGLRVVVSARSDRPQDWLRRLGWQGKGLAQSLDLEPLTQSGIRDVLERMGCPIDELARQVDIVYELHRLSAGDPLLVHLYVEDLWDQRDTVIRLIPEDLRNKKPGYGSYFEDWWEDQRKLWGADAPTHERDVRAVVNLLAVALGSLRKEDLCSLDLELDGWRVEWVLTTLRRFVIGSEEQGYTFGHPKLDEFFKDKLTKVEQRKIEARLLDWGKRTLDDLLDDKISPSEVSPYLVQNLGAHFDINNGSATDYTHLVNKRWADACFAHQGAYGSFLQDVLRVREVCMKLDVEAVQKGEKAHWLGQEIRCGLVEASLHSLAGNLKPELLSLLVKNHVWSATQALVSIQQMDHPIQKANALLLLIPLMPSYLLQDVLSENNKILEKTKRAEILCSLAERLPQDQCDWAIDEVLRISQEIEDEEERAKVLEKIIAGSQKTRWTDVLDIARTFENKTNYLRIMLSTSRFIPEVERQMVLDEALRVTQAIKNKKNYVEIMRELAEQMPELQKGEIYEEALKVVYDINDAVERASYLLNLTDWFPEERRRPIMKEVITLAGVIEKDESRADILSKLPFRIPEDMVGELFSVAQKIENKKSSVYVFYSLASRLPFEKQVEFLKQFFKGGITLRAFGHIETMHSLFKWLPIEQREELLREELNNARSTKRIAPRIASLLTCLEWCQNQEQEEIIEDVLSSLKKLKNETYLLNALISSINFLPVEYHPRILSVIRALDNRKIRILVLSALVKNTSEEEQDELLLEIFASAQEINNKYFRVEVLISIIELLPEKKREKALEEILISSQGIDEEDPLSAILPHLKKLPIGPHSELLSAARGIENDTVRAEVLGDLVESLPEEQRKEVLAEALMAARWIGDEEYHSRIFNSVVSLLPDDELVRTFEWVHKIKKQFARSDMLRILVGWLPEYLMENVLEITQKIEDDWARENVLRSLAHRLPENLMEKLLTITFEIENEKARANVLRSLIERLPEPLLKKALRAARTISDEKDRADILRVLAMRMAEKAPRKLLVATERISDEGVRAELLSALAERLPEDLLGNVLDMVRKIEDESSRVGVLKQLVERFPEAYYKDITLIISDIKKIDARIELYRILVRLLPDSFIEEMVVAVMSIGNEKNRVDILCDMVKRLPEKKLDELLPHALSIKDQAAQAQLLVALSERLPGERLEFILTAGLVIEDIKVRTNLLLILGERIPENLRFELFDDVLIVVKKMKEDKYFESVVKALAHGLPKIKLNDLLELINGINNEVFRSEVLRLIVKRLPDNWLLRALEIARTIKNNELRSITLSVIGEKFNLKQRIIIQEEALMAAQEISNPQDRVWFLCLLMDRLPQKTREEVFSEALGVARALGEKEARIATMKALMKRLMYLSLLHQLSNWHNSLPELASQKRSDLISDVIALLPLLKNIGDEKLPVELFTTVVDVTQWWP